ncbi:hypothetical protein QFZ77_004584 [Paenibacillus sp. V4I3]|uniref:hypothetical protein n=1 Tax=Paenibacillus sp. V4I3 TaxID=3042305 RepID=UPI00278561FA|nr:hypothetical protein [Paenibacillus sp. V4I3]MDQ0875925.1 hypothetical protein [Paenibacillus sp. V4I3]
MRREAGIWISVNPSFHEEILSIVKDEASRVRTSGDLLQIDIYKDNPSYQILIETIDNQVMRYTYSEGREYTKEEITQATFFSVELVNPWEHSPTSAEKFGTKYEPNSGCLACGVGKIQVSELIIDKKQIGKNQLVTINPEIIVSENFNAIVSENGLTGCNFTEVKDYKGRGLPNCFQLLIESTLRPMNKEEIIVEISKPHYCEICGQSGKILRSEVVYDSDILCNVNDFNQSYEYFGLANHRARRLIISAKARDILKKNKVLAAYEPVRIV